MQRALRAFSLVVMLALVCGAWVARSEPATSVADGAAVRAAVIVCKGTIDEGLYRSIKRRTNMALDSGAKYLIYEVGTYGGFLNSADDISKYFIFEAGKKARTVAYVTSEAISAGAMISVSCQDVIMRENTTIGDCAPIAMGEKLEGVEREKAESFVRAAFMRAAEANGYPAVLLRAMVSMGVEVYRVRNVASGEHEFFEGDRLPTDANAYDLVNKAPVVRKGELLTLTSSKAFEYGVARAEVKDLQEVLGFLAQRDGVAFVGEPLVLKTNWSEEMVRWLNSPAVMGVLFMLALLGVYTEFSSPGLSLPGLVAVVCFVTIIGSKYLVGLANWVEIALFLAGVILLAIEIVVLPGFGIAGALGIVFILAGMFGMLIKNPPDVLPWPRTSFDWKVFTDSVLGLAFGFGGFVIFAWLLAKYLPKVQFLSGLILIPSAVSQKAQPGAAVAAALAGTTITVNVGDIGEVLSPLRPAGKARFGDAVLDVVATAEFIGSGAKVQITEIHGNRVVVRIITNS